MPTYDSEDPAAGEHPARPDEAGHTGRHLHRLRKHWGHLYDIRPGYAGGWLAAPRHGPWRMMRRETPDDLAAAMHADHHERCQRLREALTGALAKVTR